MIPLKPIFTLVLLTFTIFSCKKDRYVFTMKYVKINSFEKTHLSDQYLYIKVVDTDNENVLATTEMYPIDLPFPITLGLDSNPKLNLYKRDHIAIQLWGDLSGLLKSSTIQMKHYKIQFPIDMETGDETASFSVIGTWE